MNKMTKNLLLAGAGAAAVYLLTRKSGGLSGLGDDSCCGYDDDGNCIPCPASDYTPQAGPPSPFEPTVCAYGMDASGNCLPPPEPAAPELVGPPAPLIGPPAPSAPSIPSVLASGASNVASSLWDAISTDYPSSSAPTQNPDSAFAQAQAANPGNPAAAQQAATAAIAANPPTLAGVAQQLADAAQINTTLKPLFLSANAFPLGLTIPEGLTADMQFADMNSDQQQTAGQVVSFMKTLLSTQIPEGSPASVALGDENTMLGLLGAYATAGGSDNNGIVSKPTGASVLIGLQIVTMTQAAAQNLQSSMANLTQQMTNLGIYPQSTKLRGLGRASVARVPASLAPYIVAVAAAKATMRAYGSAFKKAKKAIKIAKPHKAVAHATKRAKRISGLGCFNVLAG